MILLLPHPDDEFAVFPWILDALRQGQRVDCIWLTDGGWGGQDIERRKSESIRILRSLGLPQDAMHFLGQEAGIPDGGLQDHIDMAVAGVEHILQGTDPSRQLLVPAWEGGHPDHDAAHIVGRLLAASAPDMRAFQYPVYTGEGLSGPFFKVLHVPEGEKRSAVFARVGIAERMRFVLLCLGYRSQWKSFSGLLPFYVLKLIRRNAFAMWPVSPLAELSKPHAGLLLYERRSPMRWADFQVSTRDALARLARGRRNPATLLAS